MTEAEKHIGLKEIPGSKHNLTIVNWLKELKAWWNDDDTPWCGVFVAHCMKTAGLAIPVYYMRAKDWSNDWGITLDKPAYGCVVVFDRKGGGHVGFVVGKTTDNKLVVLGGNQGNSVSIAKFDYDRVVGYYWPSDYSITNDFRLSVISLDGNTSDNES